MPRARGEKVELRAVGGGAPRIADARAAPALAAQEAVVDAGWRTPWLANCLQLLLYSYCSLQARFFITFFMVFHDISWFFMSDIAVKQAKEFGTGSVYSHYNGG